MNTKKLLELGKEKNILKLKQYVCRVRTYGSIWEPSYADKSF